MLRCGTILTVPSNSPKHTMTSSFILSMFALATVVVFRPLLVGVLKAMVLVVKPRRKVALRTRTAVRNT